MPPPPCPLRTAEYRIVLDVDFHALRWKGTVEFEVQGSADAVDLDCAELQIEQATVDGSPVEIATDPAHERLRLRRGVRGRAALSVRFGGHVPERGLMGLYKSRYGAGYILTAHLEPDAARQLFPCIDRPDVKAVIHLTVITDAGLEVVANTPTASVTEEGARRRWTFTPTPPMATYLLYLGIGAFEHLNDTAGRVGISVLTPPGRREEGKRPIEIARTALDEFEQYYQIPYPLAKLDLIAVPEFPAGAMENWGAITFRDMQLLIRPDTPAFEMRYTVATIVHEIAHQWFGNLVTPYWWTDIWLNESFATFVEHKVVEKRFPELKSLNDFLSIWTRWGFLLDSGPSTHPIVVEVDDPKDVGQAIDRLAYGKGSSVLRMVEGYLGSDRFQAGVTDYLHRHAWKNATSGDLWEALDHASGEPITRILRPWIERPGHPIVTARLTSQGLALAQRRFGFLPGPVDEPWPIPMVLEVNGKSQRVLFDTRELTIPVPEGATIHLNPGALGFYRSLYDGALYERLLTGFERRPPSDQWIVLEDLWALLLSGEADFGTFRRFVQALERSTEALPVAATAEHLMTLYGWAGELPPVADMIRSFLATQFARIGLEPRPGEDSWDGSVRASVVAARVLADAGFARQLSEEFGHIDRLDPNVQRPVAVARALTEGARAFDELRRALANAGTESASHRFETALAYVSDPPTLEKVLGLTLTEEFYTSHVPSVLTFASMNPAGRDVTWPWLTRHLPDLVKRFHGTTLFPDFLDLALPYLGLRHPKEVRAYFQEHPFPGDDKAVVRGLAMAEVASRLAERLSKET